MYLTYKMLHYIWMIYSFNQLMNKKLTLLSIKSIINIENMCIVQVALCLDGIVGDIEVVFYT